MLSSFRIFRWILFFSVLFLFKPATVYGKKNMPGYYITNNNDTVFCHFSIDFDLFEKIKLRPLQYKIEYIDSAGAKHKFKAGEIKRFFFSIDTLSYSFVTIRNTFNTERAFHTDSVIFANILIDGYVKLYKIFYETSGGFMQGPYETAVPPIHNNKGFNYYVKKGTGEPDGVRQLYFRKDITDILNDYQELVNKINNKEYKYSDMEKVISEYNAWKR